MACDVEVWFRTLIEANERPAGGSTGVKATRFGSRSSAVDAYQTLSLSLSLWGLCVCDDFLQAVMACIDNCNIPSMYYKRLIAGMHTLQNLVDMMEQFTPGVIYNIGYTHRYNAKIKKKEFLFSFVIQIKILNHRLLLSSLGSILHYKALHIFLDRPTADFMTFLIITSSTRLQSYYSILCTVTCFKDYGHAQVNNMSCSSANYVVNQPKLSLYI